MRKGIMALESADELVDDVVDAGEPVADEVVEEIAESPEAEMGEMVEAAADVAGDGDAVDAGITVAEGVERVGERVAESVAEGGMDEGEAETVRVAVEAMIVSLGATAWAPVKNKVPAMESFAAAETRVAQTVALEASIAETAKTVWAKIIARIKAMIANIKQFFSSLFASAEKLEARAEKLEKAAKAKASAVLAEGAKVTVTAALSVDGKAVGGDAFVQALKKHTEQELVKMPGKSSGVLKDLVGALDKIAVGDEDGEARSQFAQWAKSNGITDSSVATVFGGVSVEIKVPEWPGMATASLSQGKGEGGDVDALDPKQVAAVANIVRNHAYVTIKGAKEAIAQADAAANALIGKIEAAAKAAAKESGKAKEGEAPKASNVKSLSVAVNSGMNVTSRIAVAVSKYDMKVCFATLNYAASSLNKAKAEAAA